LHQVPPISGLTTPISANLPGARGLSQHNPLKLQPGGNTTNLPETRPPERGVAAIVFVLRAPIPSIADSARKK
jgi:hypothetical protein